MQKPVYFVSKTLHGAEERYPQIEIQAHKIRVLTEYLFRKILHKLDLSGRLANWAIELGQFDLDFVSRTAIKGQVLADFLAEFTNILGNEEVRMEKNWVVYVNGSSTKKYGGAGVLLITPEGKKLNSSLRLKFRTTNNEVEYEAVMQASGWPLNLEQNQ